MQFGQLLVLGQEGPARLHAAAALRQGASLAERLGVAVTAFITGGVPASVGVLAVLAATYVGMLRDRIRTRQEAGGFVDLEQFDVDLLCCV